MKKLTNDMEELKLVINNNLYIKKFKSNTQKNINSISYLIDKNLSQSDCIKIGICLENVISDYILFKLPNLKNIKKNTKKGEIEKDHLFIDDKNKIIYYAELKCNLCLDTEKIKATIKKCLDIENELKKKYNDYQIKMFLVSIRHYCKKNIPLKISRKYNSIDNNLVGLNEYFNNLAINYNFNNEDEYKKILNYVVDKMFYK
jgi:hypothetical protein